MLAEARQAEREAQRIRETLERALEDLERWQDAQAWVLEDLDRAEERAVNAYRLLKDAL